MKASEAPEKIYVHIKDKPCEITFSEVIEKECSNIEYIRKDALIKEVCEWLDDHLGCYIGAQDFMIEHARLNNDLVEYLEDES